MRVVVAGQDEILAVDSLAESQKDHDARMQWWREARFGLFVHWGLYSVAEGKWNGEPIEGTAEWIMHHAKIPVDEYRNVLLPQFNPTEFDAVEWAALARDAGVQYLVITAKHHDGFCLFDSDRTDFDVKASPFNRDIMRELFDACRAEGIRIGWYYSILDWSHPKAHAKSWDEYALDLHHQVDELLQNYGQIDIMWFDGEWIPEWTEPQGRLLYQHIREISPATLINNRVGKGRQGMAGTHDPSAHVGDFGTPEQQIPRFGLPGYDWESCMTMNDTWGYSASDTEWKSAATLIQQLIDATSKGGNFLLNVGPDGLGKIPDASQFRLHEMGDWLEKNGQSVYGTKPGPFRKLKWGRCTVDGVNPSRLYFHIYDWPTKTSMLRIPGLMSKVERVWFLERGETSPLWKRADRQGLMVRLGKNPPNAHVSVLVVDVVGAPDVIELPVLQHARTGVVHLDAFDAELHGQTIRYESDDSKKCIGYWSNADEYITWKMQIRKPGTFEVMIDYACDKGEEGSVVSMGVAHADDPDLIIASATGEISPTGSWTSFEKRSLGTIEIPSIGVYSITLRPTEIARSALMNLQSLQLNPQ